MLRRGTGVRGQGAGARRQRAWRGVGGVLQCAIDVQIELQVPFATGARVTIFVIEEPPDRFDDLLSAAESSLAFWDNSYDDEDWNHA